MNPFKDPTTVIRDDDEDNTEIDASLIEVGEPKNWVYEDHVVIEGVNIIRVPYFFDRIQNLPSYQGFVARWYLPGEPLQF